MIPELSAREIAVSGLKAQRARLNVIANNIANAQTTRTPDGGPFRRQLVIFRGEQVRMGASAGQAGVRVKSVVPDSSPFRQVYDPEHPDADAQGYVSYPNVDIAIEMTDLISAQRAYEANVAVIVSGKRMQEQALEIIRV
ncbi:MAG TPA: flagellar basal body rod protein FlgC [Candidatus Hydrogenedentes bacterium]|nr:flagellar basal body rod protein FlgC [Candidatus Hydrogenedentota bacterium]HPG67890.1 flagellar basal body rod protein FlgC [Candidatus Hydrogenedentota bacterium]